VSPPKRAQTEDLLKALTQASLSERGRVAFDVFRQIGQANHFTLFETWKSPANYVQHGKGAAAIAFRKAISPLLGALYDERIYRRLS
jgi:quinol monooxygenase YgiN